MKKFTKTKNIYENKTYSLISNEYKYKNKLLKKKPKVTQKDYETACIKA
jgi:hypothetical protein